MITNSRYSLCLAVGKPTRDPTKKTGCSIYYAKPCRPPGRYVRSSNLSPTEETRLCLLLLGANDRLVRATYGERKVDRSEDIRLYNI